MRELNLNEIEQVNGGIYQGSGACAAASFALGMSPFMGAVAVLIAFPLAWSACM